MTQKCQRAKIVDFSTACLYVKQFKCAWWHSDGLVIKVYSMADKGALHWKTIGSSYVV